MLPTMLQLVYKCPEEDSYVRKVVEVVMPKKKAKVQVGSELDASSD